MSEPPPGRTLFDAGGLQVAHVTVRPRSAACGEIEVADRHVLALTLDGLFALHDGPRTHTIATPAHALFIPAGLPHRLSFPGAIGDRCLVLRFTDASLAERMPRDEATGGRDAAAFARRAPLEPRWLVERAWLATRLARGEIDALEVEERSVCLLAAALHAGRAPARRRAVPQAAAAARRRRQLERVREAVAAEPDRRWTLAELATLACVSPGHLAHAFRADEGTPLYQYVLRVRLARALDAVIESDTDLTAIALDAGFASHSHFTARFRALFGCTPLELRRRRGPVREARRIATARQGAAA